MRQILLIFALFCASYMTVNAQTNTWNGNADTNWSNAANWSLNAVPTASNDVVIPTGKTVNLNVAAAVKSIAVQGNSTFHIYNNFSFLNASSFATNVTVNWSNASLYGGGTLTNNGTVNLPSSNSKSIEGLTTFSNKGDFNITDSGDLYINNGIFNNETSGTIDMQAYVGDISYTGNGASRILNNFGTIKKTISGNPAYIYVILNNNDGTISVESGTLGLLDLDKNLTDGIYNVTAGAILQWNSNTVLDGTLTGVLDGEIAWTNTVTVADENQATFNFTGDSGVSWSNGNLDGGGTLINQSLIFLPSTNNKSIEGLTTLSNEGDFNITDSGDLNINNGVFNNETSGTIDMQAYVGDISYTGSGTSRILNNFGTIKKTTTGNPAYIHVILNNNGGTINVEIGNLSFQGLDKNLTDGIYNVSAGAILQWNSNTVLDGTLTGVLDGEIAWTNTVTVTDENQATFNFMGDSGVSWSNGNLDGGGTLVNQSLIFLPSTNDKSIEGLTTLSNEGDFNITDSGDLNINNGVFNNETSGTIDMQAYVGDISYTGSGTSRILNNFGTIKKTISGNPAYIYVILNNNDGTISVESGTLGLQGLDKHLTDGSYNVSTGSVLQWNSNTILNGTLIGILDGKIDWTNTVTVVDGNPATFNFTGDSGVSWSNGNLIGGGTLVNQSLIFLPTTNNKSIEGLTTLSNEGDFNITDSGDLNINNGVFNNETSGTIDMQAYVGDISYTGSGTSRILNNFGTLKKTTTGNPAYIYVQTTNSGTIDVQTGTLYFQDPLGLNNTVDGIIKGISTIDIPVSANFTNNGTFAPGGSPGTLTVLGDYKSSTTSVLDVELNGLVQNTDYDLLAITGTNVIFDGDVTVTMGFDAAIGNSFTIATVSGTIATKSLTTPFTADYNGFRYTFNVTYPNDKAVKLTVSARLDIQPPTIIAQNVTLQLNSSGTASLTTAMVNNGTTDNGSLPANISYSLDKTSFTCSDLGDNTVTLTATDEANNASTATATVTVVDSMNPTVTCGGNSSIDSDGVYTLPDYTTNGVASAADNCSATLVQTPAPSTSLPDGIHAISFVATDTSGNTANCSFNLTVIDTSLGINDFELTESSIQLYPNPVRNILTIKNLKQAELVNGQIMDVTGKVIKTIDLKLIGLTKEISLENLSSGMYFVRINGLNSSVTKRIIKQ